LIDLLDTDVLTFLPILIEMSRIIEKWLRLFKVNVVNVVHGAFFEVVDEFKIEAATFPLNLLIIGQLVTNGNRFFEKGIRSGDCGLI